MSVPRPLFLLLLVVVVALPWVPRGAVASPRTPRETLGDPLGEGPAEPHPVSRLALFPDRPAWCETRNITQIISHAGCTSREIDNRVCLGQCYSYSVPDTLPQTSESLLHCDSCTPADTTWDVVTLHCGDDYSDGGDTEDDGAEGSLEVTKLVEKILRCECQACGAQQHLLLAAAGEGHGADPLLASMAQPDRESEAAGEPARALPHNPEFGAPRGGGDDEEAAAAAVDAAGQRHRAPAGEQGRRGESAAAVLGGADGAEESAESLHEGPRQHGRGHRQQHGNAERPAAGLWAGEEYGGL